MLYLLILSLLGSTILFTECSATCDWRSQEPFYAVKAILENKIKQNDTILWELAGIFSNKQKPLKQVIARYKIMIPTSDGKSCDTAPNCDLAYTSNNPKCPDNYSCIALDYIWGRYPMTAQDVVFRDLDVCPLVIGDYEQREIDIHFVLKGRPSCNSSISTDSIEKEELPCGWQCEVQRIKLPENGGSSQTIFRSVNRETPLEKALSGITAKLLAYGTVKAVIEPLHYNVEEVKGYAAKLHSATYFHQFVEYGLFFSSYVLMNVVILMLVYKYKTRVYLKVYNYVTKDKIKFCLFWSFIITFFLLFCNITLIFAIEGGICITLLQLYLLCISLFPGLIYALVTTCRLKRKNGFFSVFKNLICVKFHLLDHLMQVLVFTFLFTLPHVAALVVYFASVSFFYNPPRTSLLLLYFSSSSIILWIANAVFLFLVSPFLFVCCYPLKRSDLNKICFAICLGLSLNLMNFSVMPFIGDYFYDKRVEGTSIFAIVPIAITLVGWYISGDVVKLFSIFSNKEEMDNSNNMDMRSAEATNVPDDNDQPLNEVSIDLNEEETSRSKIESEQTGFFKLRPVADALKAVHKLKLYHDDTDNISQESPKERNGHP